MRITEAQQLKARLEGMKYALSAMAEDRDKWKRKAESFRASLERLLDRHNELLVQMAEQAPELTVDLKPVAKIGGLELKYDPEDNR